MPRSVSLVRCRGSQDYAALHHGVRPMLPYTCQHFVLEALNASHGPMLHRYAVRNREHLAAWEPERDASYFSEAEQAALLRQQLAAQQAQHTLHLVAREPDGFEILARCNFTLLQRGVSHSAHVGYSVDGARTGQGLMTQVLAAALAHVFSDEGLHRVMAAYMPENVASGRVLDKLGFVREGYAQAYLHIAGAWRDHVLTARINPDWRPRG